MEHRNFGNSFINDPHAKANHFNGHSLATINGLGNFNIPNIFFGTSNGPENSALVVGVNL